MTELAISVCKDWDCVCEHRSRSTIEDDTEAVNTITIVDKTMSIMEDCPIPSSFFGQQIYGDLYPNEVIPLPTFDHSSPRPPLIAVDPVVHNINHKPSQSAFPVNGYRERLLGHYSRTGLTSAINPISSARSLVNIANSQKPNYPLETLSPQSPELKIYRQNTTRTVDPRPAVWNKLPPEPNDRANFYSLQEGLNLTREIQNDEYEEERAMLTAQSGPKPSPRLRASQFLNCPPYHALPLSTPEPSRQNSYEMTPDPLENSQKLTSSGESQLQCHQYKTILYVVPNSPTDKQDLSKGNSWHTDHQDSLELYRRSQEELNTKYLTNGGQQNEIPTARNSPFPHYFSCRSPGDVKVQIEHDPHKQYPGVPLDPSTCLLQQQNRYDINEKPHFETLPSPRQMAVNMPANGYNTIPLQSIEPIVQPTTVRLARSDYNQVIVDIKPRQLNEADKQQHVSQWIQVGTLGDTVSSQVEEPSESTLEEEEPSDVVQPVQYDVLDDQELAHRRGQNLLLNSTSRSPGVCDTPSQSEEDLRQQLREGLWSPTVGRISEKRDTFETEVNHPGTPETVLTSSSMKSNIVINLVGRRSISRVKKLHEGELVEPPAIYHAECKPFPEIYHRTHSPERQSPERIITIKPNPVNLQLPETSHMFPKGQSMTMPANQKTATPGITRVLSERYRRPQVAPKPTPLEQLSIIQDKRALTTTGAEIRHLNSKVSSRISKPSFISCTFPRYSNSSSRAHLNKPDWLYDGNEYYLESARDTPVPNVRHLTAYFSDLIERQNDTSGSVNSIRLGEYGMTDPCEGDERHTTLSNQTPFLLYHETDEERRRRLRAVENLRSRTALPTTDYIRPLSHSWEKDAADSAPEDMYSYCRPKSAPKYKSKYISTHIFRGSTPFSDGN
ncbi:hypothetical protein D915_003506 [Fasciola hepatica]|uniref:Uncharacterized protein n=1 Tax=Fasciola hepatica TaxID=6192 RepID=A0A4E0RDN1_FASHE|nr:hypothetical protein D915_003506 [Fasciola hepatica]